MNAVYSNKSFLRVLILSENDALDKIRYISLPNPEVLEKKELKIEIIPNPDEKVGIWMIKEDIVNNIVIIARSGTKKCIEIGQFDVGFYSAYLVSKRVVVINKQSENNEDEQHVWKIKASGTFRVRDDSDNPYLIKRGTDIYVKNNCANFCKEKTLKEIVKHSQFIFTINLLIIKEEKKKKKIHELLFVPKKAPFQQTLKEKNIKLFVPR
ncbi:hypothetical protein RFI_31756, partial [Reticulomyxa filosa]